MPELTYFDLLLVAFGLFVVADKLTGFFWPSED